MWQREGFKEKHYLASNTEQVKKHRNQEIVKSWTEKKKAERSEQQIKAWAENKEEWLKKAMKTFSSEERSKLWKEKIEKDPEHKKRITQYLISGRNEVDKKFINNLKELINASNKFTFIERRKYEYGKYKYSVKCLKCSNGMPLLL